MTSGVPQGPTLDFLVSPLLIQTVGSGASSANVQRSHKKDGEKLFSRASCDRTRCNGFQVKEGRFRLHIRKNYFIVMLMNYWERLQREVVDAPSMETFRVRLERALSNV